MNRHVVPYIILVLAVLVAVLRRRRGHAGGLGTWLARRWRTALAGRVPAPRRGRPVPGATGLVARREVRQRLRGRAFRIATVVVLAGVAAAILIPAAIRGGGPTQQVGVVGAMAASERSGIVAAADHAGIRAQLVTQADTGAADQALRSGQIDVAVIDSATVLLRTEITSGDTSTTAQLARVISSTLGTAKALTAARLTPAQAAALGSATPVPIRGLEVAPMSGAERGSAIAGLIIVLFMLSQYLTWTLTGVMEEKSSRVVEVLLATVRPVQLLAGKLLGIGVVVFTQAAIFAVVAFGLEEAVGSNLLHGTAPRIVASALAWLVLGYAFYSWLYAAAGSLIERQDQVQSIAIPLALPTILGYVVALTTLSAGHASLFAEVLAYLPPTAPFMMPVLMAVGAAGWWQFAGSAAISLASTVGIAALASTVYRRAILRTGARVRLREVLGRSGS